MRPTLVSDLATLQAPFVAYLWIGILTFTTYALAGHMREQVCLYMCPWPRIQAALTDEHALNVTYRYDRGEPRGSVKKSAALRAQGLPAGDCIDCLQCVHVCPTGVDIRNGPNLGCIQCGLCIDACDAVMAKIGRPTRLIAYDTDLNIQRREQGRSAGVRIVRMRTVLYAAIIAAVGGVMLYALATRSAQVDQRHPRPQSDVRAAVRRRDPQRLHGAHHQQALRTARVHAQHRPGSPARCSTWCRRRDGRPRSSSRSARTRPARCACSSPTTPTCRRASTPITFHLYDVQDRRAAQPPATISARPQEDEMIANATELRHGR